MNAIYIQDGDAIDHAPIDTLPAGSVVVQGHLVGVTPRPIPAGGLGSLLVEGVFDLPVAPGATAAIGDLLFWNPATNLAILDATVAGAVYCGVSVLPLAPADTRVRIRLNHPR